MLEGIDVASFYDLSIGICNCSNGVVFFVFHFIIYSFYIAHYLIKNYSKCFYDTAISIPIHIGSKVQTMSYDMVEDSDNCINLIQRNYIII